MTGLILARRTRLLSAAALAALLLFLAVPCAVAQSQYPPLFRSNWGNPVAPEGFGDRQNSWAWSMMWYNNNLLVGTARSEDCVTAESQHQILPSEPYPPTDPRISCPANPNDLSLQAEIWSYDPTSAAWTMVFQSPLTIAVPNTSPTLMVPPDIGFRGMTTFTEPDGTNALYVGGCSSLVIHPGVPGGRLLRSTDGVNFAPVPQDAGTFLGNLDNTCFRGMLTFNGQFFAMAVNYKGQGTVIQSPTPWLGDNTFQQVSSPATPAYEIAVFNNNLYVTFVNETTGFSVARTNATGPLPYTYVTVLADGGYRTPYADPRAVSLQVYDGYLYVGGDGQRTNVPLTDQGAELFRIHTDDTWDLIAGISRSTPVGQVNSLSGLGVGFDWFLNQHMWRMTVYDGRLYVGTYDESTELRNTKQGSQYTDEFGFDLWWTQDGTYFSQVDQQGFEDEFNIGVRSFAVTPYGVFLGSANPFYGLDVYQGIATGFVPPTGPNLAGATLSAARPDPPQHLQVEGGKGGVLLSWDPPESGAKQYHVFRQSYTSIDTKDVGVGSDGPAYFRSAWQEIGVSEKLTYQDAGASLEGRYAYQVKAEDEQGLLSEYSNFVAFPSAAPPVTFADARDSLSKLARAAKFRDAATGDLLAGLLQQAESEAVKGHFDKLLALWGSLKDSAGADFRDPVDARGLELILSRLSKRAQLVQAGLLSPAALGAALPLTTNASSAPTLNCTGTPLVCVQPTTGPQGNDYTYGSVTVNGPYWANNRYTNNNVEYYIYEPGTPTPPKAPVILFLHGYAAFTTADYQAWINQMVQKGYVVVWAAYQASLTSTFADYPANAQAAWTDALYRLQNYTWEPHVRPYIVNGVTQTMIVGHSFGGWITAWLAGQASTAIPTFPIPLGLVMIEPASLGLLPPINFAGISPATQMLILSADQDNVACSADGVSIFTSTTQVPAAQKNYLWFNSDLTGTPNQVGDHYFPNSNGYDDTAAIDNRDFYVTYKLSVSAAQCMFLGNNCNVFLGNGNADQLSMGHWQNGTPINTMSYYADPTQLPAIPGCPQ
jgi:pimeloyl-ACP methyl ester carboxylesterase